MVNYNQVKRLSILGITLFILFFAKISYADVLNVASNAKHANDNTTESISEITSDNSSVNPDTLSAVAAGDGVYTVDKSAIMQFTAFDVSAIPVGSTITGAVLHLQYGAEDGYNGTNAVRYDNGSGLTSTGITPTDITGFSSDLTYNLFSAGVDTSSEIQNVDIEFTNNDSGGADAIHFDYLWITVTYTPPANITTLGNGTNPSNSSIAPGASATDLDAFTLQANSGTDTVTAVTVSLAAGTSGALSLVSITSDGGGTIYCSAANPASDTVSLASCAIPVTTSSTQFKIRITPKTHANMPSPPGLTYSVTGTVTAYTCVNSKSGTDTNSATVTIDNASPSNITSASGSAGDEQVSLSWTNPADSDYHSAVVLRRASSAVADTPVEGTTYIVGNAIGTATVACVVASPTATCTDTGLNNGTVYHYKIFSRDANVNYSLGVVPTGSPFTPTAAPDTTAPAAVTNLTALNPGQNSMQLTWTAPGDDNNTGTATAYDIRYSTSNITEGNWSSATPVDNEPTPLAAGTSQSMTISGLTADTVYFFALKTSDEAPNTSALSNVPSGATTATPDTTVPSAVADLAASSPSDSAITLSWTAPGDDGNSGTATSYDVRYSTSNITDGNWSSVTQVSGEPAPLAAGASQSKTVTGLSPGTTYYFAMKTSDEVPNISALSNVSSLATIAAPDTTAPAAVTNLTALNPGQNSMQLTWTAPGDDNNTGTATAYDIRYSTSNITEGNWSSATPVDNEPTPLAAGTSQSMTISGLTADTVYFFALKTSDEAPNTSALSNVPSLATAVGSSITIPSGGGEGGAAVAPRRVIFSGQAYPLSTIEVLRKSIQSDLYAQMPIEDKTISADGSFIISYTGMLGGDYLFALRIQDKEGRSTGMLAFSVPLQGDLFEAKDILVPPTIGFDKSLVAKNDVIKVTGYAAPNIMVELQVDNLKYKEIKTSQFGFWSVDLDVTYFAYGEHQARARQTDAKGKVSNFSITRTFKLSQLPVSRADLNGDGVVSISDWSIFLWRWGSDKEELKSQNDINGDGKINIFDFSIFLQTMKL